MVSPNLDGQAAWMKDMWVSLNPVKNESVARKVLAGLVKERPARLDRVAAGWVVRMKIRTTCPTRADKRRKEW